MENIATSVRITAAANALLSALAGKTGKPKAQIVEEALRDWEDRTFWTEVRQAFAAGTESNELRTERELWERTVPDGLGPVKSERFGSKPLRSKSRASKTGSKPDSKNRSKPGSKIRSKQ